MEQRHSDAARPLRVGFAFARFVTRAAAAAPSPPSPAQARGLEETRLKPLQRAISRMDGSRRSRHACTLARNHTNQLIYTPRSLSHSAAHTLSLPRTLPHSFALSRAFLHALLITRLHLHSLDWHTCSQVPHTADLHSPTPPALSHALLHSLEQSSNHKSALTLSIGTSALRYLTKLI